MTPPTDEARATPRELLTDALGELWVLEDRAGLIERWHGDPNLDCKATATEIVELRAKVHDLIVKASRLLEEPL